MKTKLHVYRPREFWDLCEFEVSLCVSHYGRETWGSAACLDIGAHLILFGFGFSVDIERSLAP